MGCGLCSGKATHNKFQKSNCDEPLKGDCHGPRHAGLADLTVTDLTVTPQSSPNAGGGLAWSPAQSETAHKSYRRSRAEVAGINAKSCLDSATSDGGENSCSSRWGVEAERLRATAAAPAVSTIPTIPGSVQDLPADASLVEDISEPLALQELPPDVPIIEDIPDPPDYIPKDVLDNTSEAADGINSYSVVEKPRAVDLCKRPEAAQSTPSATSRDKACTVKYSFPDVDVSMPSRVMLLTWAKWGRNSWRIKEEERIKSLQHIKYPKIERRPYTPLTSPQATPRGGYDASISDETTIAKAEETGAALAIDQRQVQETLAARHRERGGGSVVGRSRNEVPKASWAYEMKQEQRESMNEQGTKIKLEQQLGPAKAITQSSGTPGFGIDTPNFPGVRSRTSANASAEASVASSGVASPLADGQVSPWLLEAEALVNGEDDTLDEHTSSGSKPSLAWGMSPASLEQIPEMSDFIEHKAAATPEPRSLSEEFATIQDGDELDNVNVFEPVSASSLRKNAACSQIASVTEGEDLLDCTTGASDSAAAPTTAPTTSTSSPLSSASGTARASASAPAAKEVCIKYAPGDLVKYWSGSHGVWLHARIVEQRSRSVYLIDKQMKGCFSKVRASDIVSEAEERQDPVLRACVALERDAQFAPKSRSPRATPQYANLPSQVAQRSTQTVHPTALVVQQVGRIVRDDFSDDSDD